MNIVAGHIGTGEISEGLLERDGNAYWRVE